jgi:glucosamine--fructose-6-phosphate aminotransferase (isomerizing)
MSKMLEEIRQQPAALERTLRLEMPLANRLRGALAKKRPRLIVLAARGTSDNAALFGRYLLEISTGIPVVLAAPSVLTLYGARMELRDAFVVALSQSGESTDTNFVLERASELGATTAGVTNEAKSAMARIAEFPFLVRAGREQSIAATKTYTGQMLVLYLIAYALGARIDIDALRRIPEWVESALALEPRIAEMSERYRFMDHAVVVGRGLNYSNAFEFALKLMETCYVVAERFSTADFLHGPIAIVERSFPVFVFAPPGVTWSSTCALIERLRALKAETLVIADRGHREALAMAPRSIAIPAKLPRSRPVELYTPIPYIVPAQLLAARLAEQKGLDPDHPRALRKVTRTR